MVVFVPHLKTYCNLDEECVGGIWYSEAVILQPILLTVCDIVQPTFCGRAIPQAWFSPTVCT